MEYYKDEIVKAEKEISRMDEIIKSEMFDENYIRELISKQKGELNVHSDYYDGNIAEGNWSQIEDSNIEKINDKRFY